MNARIMLVGLLAVACSEPKVGGKAPASSPVEAAPATVAASAEQRAPDLVVDVVARKWLWTFTYPGGFVSQELHLPADSRVRLQLRSIDVAHVFSAEALGVTASIPAGGEATVDVDVGPPANGEVHNAATDDPRNAEMRAPLVVAPDEVHEAWLRESAAEERLAGRPPAEWGEHLFGTLGCKVCHSIDGKVGTGPSLAGVWARTTAGTTQLTDGRTVGELIGEGRTHASVADYIAAEILEPSEAVVQGFPPVQPSFRGVLDEAELDALLAYLETL